MANLASERAEVASLREIANRGKEWMTVKEFERLNAAADLLSRALADTDLLDRIIQLGGVELRTTPRDAQAWPGGVDWSAHKGDEVGYGMNGPRDAIVALLQKCSTFPEPRR